MLRAFRTTYLRRGRRVGGSTITMQLARQRFGNRLANSDAARSSKSFAHRSWSAFYSKDEILEAYLNVAPYGGNIEGVGAASLVYFHELPKQLSLAQASYARRDPAKSRAAEIQLRRSGRRAARHGATNDLARSGQGLTVLVFIDTNMNLVVHIASRRELPYRAPHLVDRVLATSGSGRIRSTLDPAAPEVCSSCNSGPLSNAVSTWVSAMAQ